MLKIGLTGGIASGKSKALQFFETLGAQTIDADQLARKVVETGQPALQKILKRFGEEYRLNDGSLDRQALADLVFSEPAALQDLNQIVHPYVIQEENRRLRELKSLETDTNPFIVIVDAALMIEVGTYQNYDVILVVYCPHRTQLQRLMARTEMSRKQALKRIENQMPALEKISYADYVINSSGPVTETHEQIHFVYRELLYRFRNGSLTDPVNV
jgi:dephospho-CoA kinase